MRSSVRIDAIPSFLASLIAPPRCGACAGRCPWRAPLCELCEAELAGIPGACFPATSLDAAWSAAPYVGVARDLVVALKFYRRTALAQRAAEAIAASAPPDLLDGAVVPVPPDPWRVRVRGHDPADEISFALARLSGLPFRPCLKRPSGPRQVGRRRAARVAEPPRVRLAAAPPRRVIVVDDVITTGATLAECGRALRVGGTEYVAGVTFARSRPRPRQLGLPASAA